MKTVLFEDIWIPPQFEVSFFLTVEDSGLAPCHLAEGQECAKAIKFADTVCSEQVERLTMTDRTETEEIIDLRQFKKRDGQRPLPGSEISQCGVQLPCRCPLHQAKGRGHGRVKPIIPWPSCQVGESFRINSAETRLR